MEIEYIKEVILDIQYNAYDDERAHGMEDDLYFEFIKHVADLELGELSEKAKLVLSSKQIEFKRWCA